MAKIRHPPRSRSRLYDSATAFMRLRLPPDFIIPEYCRADIDLNEDDEPQDIDSNWARCLQSLHEVPDFVHIMCGRLVEDPAMAILFTSAYSPEALDSLLSSPQFKAFLAALGHENTPPHFRTTKPIWSIDLYEPRVTLATFSFPYPATPEQREGYQSQGAMIPLPALHYELSPHGWSSRTLGPRPTCFWVLGKQTLPDGREVQDALLVQKWRRPEVEDAAAGVEGERREAWKGAVAGRLGLVRVEVERYDMYKL